MHIAIIGNGISGITAARFIRKLSDHRISVISSESEYFFSRTALMYIYMGLMRQKDTQPYEPGFWKKNRIDLVFNHVSQVNFEAKKLVLEQGRELEYDRLIIATGSSSNKFGWPGQDLDGVHGMYSLQDLEAIERHSEGLRRAVIVGGGLIGIEMAEMFHSRKIPVTMLVRESSYWNNVLPPQESEMINRHILEHGIDLRLSTELASIQASKEEKVRSVLTKDGEEIECQFVGLTAGVHPNIDFLKNSGLETQRGILIDKNLQTNIPDVYAIGDCAQLREPKPGRRGVEAIWYTGRMMGEVAAYNICGHSVEYDPGIWFNSAKFFDIEYQVYGSIDTKASDTDSVLYWEHEGGKKGVRIQFDSNTKEIRGFNLMGVRFRHEVCEKWIKDKTHVEEVLENLTLASFDPEFFKNNHLEIIDQYNQEHNRTISLKSKGRLNQVLNFLKA